MAISFSRVALSSFSFPNTLLATSITKCKSWAWPDFPSGRQCDHARPPRTNRGGFRHYRENLRV